jgi:large subunit ribosomal protein L24e
MVVKRQCSFCAGEIEPGTGFMFVKRDGSVFHFCSSSCRKQQLVLGRVGHRFKWTRAHALKRAQTASAAAGALTRTGPSRSGSRRITASRAPPAKPPATSARGTEPESVAVSTEETKTPTPKTEARPPRKPRVRKPKPEPTSDAAPPST